MRPNRGLMPAARRRMVIAAIVAYLGYLAVGLYWHVVGDVGVSPPGQYLVTWDMFPGYRTRSQRIEVLGETARGEFVRLYPSPRQRWRGGLNGDLTRIDFAQQPFLGTEANWLEAEIAAALAMHDVASPDDPIRSLHVIREWWPAKFNLPPAAYESLSLDGDPPLGTRYQAAILTAPADDFLEEVTRPERDATAGEPR